MTVKQNDEKKWDKIAEQSTESEETAAASEEPVTDTEATEGEAPAAAPLPTYDELVEQLTTAEAVAQANLEQAKLATANYDNLQKRAANDVKKAHQFALERFAKDLLPVVDSLDRALESTNEEHAAIREGIELTRKMFMDTLEKYGITAINPVGETFDPNLHEAMSTQADANAEPNTVLAVMQKGYLLHQRLLRPAMVIVCKKDG